MVDRTSTEDARSIEIIEITGIIKSQSGRNVLRRILLKTGVFNDSFDPDPIKHARNSGERAVGLWLMRELAEAAPGEFSILLRELFDG